MSKKTDILIRRYEEQDEEALFALLMREGDEWKGYWDAEGKPRYQKALKSSVTYLIFENNVLCGFARCRDDDGFGIYVYDLLVDKECRGREYGRLLMEKACSDCSGEEAYVMSDVDAYYRKLGYEKEGSIFIIRKK